MLNQLVRISPLIGTLLVFCGTLKMIFYYSAFGISIIDFLSFSEIITSFLDDINLLVMFAFVILFPTIKAVDFVSHKAEVSEIEAADGILSIFFPWRYALTVLFGTVGLSLYFFGYFGYIRYNYLVIYLIVVSVLQFLTYISLKKDKNEEVNIPNLSAALSIAITLLTALFLLAKHDVLIAKEGKSTVEVLTKSESFICNVETGNIYVGKIDGSVFIWDKSVGATVVVPTSEVLKYRFK